jgi:hypothetical protein
MPGLGTGPIVIMQIFMRVIAIKILSYRRPKGDGMVDIVSVFAVARPTGLLGFVMVGRQNSKDLAGTFPHVILDFGEKLVVDTFGQGLDMT